eukprot:366512-Chlamydomonas_euryale.AAC.18
MEVACSRLSCRTARSRPHPAPRRRRAVAGCVRIAAAMLIRNVCPSLSLVAKGTGTAKWLKPRRPPSRVESYSYFAEAAMPAVDFAVTPSPAPKLRWALWSTLLQCRVFAGSATRSGCKRRYACVGAAV